MSFLANSAAWVFAKVASLVCFDESLGALLSCPSKNKSTALHPSPGVLVHIFQV